MTLGEAVGKKWIGCAQHHIDAYGQRPLFQQLLIRSDGATSDTGVVHCREAVSSQRVHRCHKRELLFFDRRRWNVAANQGHCVVDKNSGRLTVGVAQNLTAIGVGGILRYTGKLHGCAVSPAGVPVYA